MIIFCSRLNTYFKTIQESFFDTKVVFGMLYFSMNGVYSIPNNIYCVMHYVICIVYAKLYVKFLKKIQLLSYEHYCKTITSRFFN